MQSSACIQYGQPTLIGQLVLNRSVWNQVVNVISVWICCVCQCDWGRRYGAGFQFSASCLELWHHGNGYHFSYCVSVVPIPPGVLQGYSGPG